MELAGRVLEGDEKSAARLISMIERDEPDGMEAVSLLFPHTGKAHIIGVTGVPGAGKSTLIDGLAWSLAAEGKKVGIIAVDPTSATGDGALLGDRLRMRRAGAMEGVFIRSMAHRGFPGGLARATLGALYVLDALGKEVIIIESVGAGQTEVQISLLCQTLLTVLTPDYGDEIQLMKAGLVEIGDIVVVNKADRPGAEDTVQDLTVFLRQRGGRTWEIPVVKVQALAGEGMDGLRRAIAGHQTHLLADSGYPARKSGRLKALSLTLLKEECWRVVTERLREDRRCEELLASVAGGTLDPYRYAKQAMELIAAGRKGGQAA